MAALTAAKIRFAQLQEGSSTRNVDVAAGAVIWQGAIVAGTATGAVPAPGAQNEPFIGIAKFSYDNTGAALTTDQPLELEVGQMELLTLSTTPVQDDLGKPVYYVDDQTVTLTPPADLTTRVGTIARIKSGSLIYVNTKNNWETT